MCCTRHFQKYFSFSLFSVLFPSCEAGITLGRGFFLYLGAEETTWEDFVTSQTFTWITQLRARAWPAGEWEGQRRVTENRRSLVHLASGGSKLREQKNGDICHECGFQRGKHPSAHFHHVVSFKGKAGEILKLICRVLRSLSTQSGSS